MERTRAEREDQIIQSALLIHVMVLHPTPLTEDDLIRELAQNPEDFGERDGVVRAIRDLASVGLLHRYARLVLPSRAALTAHELWLGDEE